MSGPNGQNFRSTVFVEVPLAPAGLVDLTVNEAAPPGVVELPDSTSQGAGS